MGKAETKYTNTAKKMQNALCSLLSDTRFDAITVTMLCDEARVDRSTFYAHYDKLVDLLNETVSMLMDELDKSANAKSLDIPRSAEWYLDRFLALAERNRALFMANPNAISSSIGKRVLSNLALLDERTASSNRISDESRDEYRAVYEVAGLMRVVNAWLEDDCVDDRDSMIDIIFSCLNRASERNR